MFTNKANDIFRRAIADYHEKDNVDTPMENPYRRQSIDSILYHKCWIDTVQWHLEDIIRDPDIDPVEALKIKRRIDKSNQDRTDMVEDIDTYFRELYHGIKPFPDATINTESPAWAIDRLSILALKIWHMKEQTERTDADPTHIAICHGKLEVRAPTLTLHILLYATANSRCSRSSRRTSHWLLTSFLTISSQDVSI